MKFGLYYKLGFATASEIKKLDQEFEKARNRIWQGRKILWNANIENQGSATKKFIITMVRNAITFSDPSVFIEIKRKY